MRTIVRGGTVVTAAHTTRSDVLIDGEQIVAVGDLGEVDAKEIDAAGCFVLPGLIDNHTHMSMPWRGSSTGWRGCGTRASTAGA